MVHPGPLQRVAPVSVGFGAALAAGYVTVNDPMRSGWFLPCPLRELTGWSCPGCGMTRAVHHLLHGDVIESVQLNLFAPVVVALLGLVWVAWLCRDTLGLTVRRPQLPVAATPVVLLGLLVYGVARNLT